MAILYPVYWLAQFCLNSLPGLLEWVFAGYGLKWVRISALGSSVLSGTLNDPPVAARFALRGFGAETLPAVLVVVLVGTAVLYFGRRKARFASGLFVALLGFGGFEDLLRRLWYSSPNPVWVAAVLIFGALWTIGLHRLISATSQPGMEYGWRFAAAVLGFTAPLGLLFLAFHWTAGMPLLRRMVWVFFPGLVPVALASAWPVSARSAKMAGISWKAVGGGVLATAFMATTVALAGPSIRTSFARRRAARAAAMVASLPRVSANERYPRVFFQKGVNFTAEFGAPYASVDALEALKRLAPYGVNAIALVPYGWMQAGSPRVRVRAGLDVWESDQGIEDVARLAHALGMKVFLKPQLWVRGGSPTEIDFRDPAERAEWFEQYGRFLDHYARLATRVHADLFSVGVELAKLSRYDARWRALIAGVRKLYPGPLVYSANFGTGFRSVSFWDALDYIGLDEYYPLPRDLSTVSLVHRIERVEVRYRRPVVFTEVGFPSLSHPELRPWDRSLRPISLGDQERCYRAIFRAFYGKPWFEGMYWWKVGTNEAGGPEDGSFTPWGKPAMGLVKRWYASRRR